AGATAATRFEPGQDLEALADTLRRAHRKPLNLVVRGTGLPPLAVERGDMLELLGNLLDNACKWA
ncbi:MAG TPA: ATP-binding protein, partial [Alcanivorax sp.]|nr:ATP-binding protein [Alcanivorax sp.]